MIKLKNILTFEITTPLKENFVAYLLNRLCFVYYCTNILARLLREILGPGCSMTSKAIFSQANSYYKIWTYFSPEFKANITIKVFAELGPIFSSYLRGGPKTIRLLFFTDFEFHQGFASQQFYRY